MTPDRQMAAAKRLVSLLRRLFHSHFVPAENVAAGQAHEVTPAYFYAWLERHMLLMSADAECEAAGVPADTWGELVDLLADPVVTEKLFPLWYHVVLPAQPQPPATVRSLNVMYTVTFEDGGVFGTQALIPASAIVTDGPLTGADVASVAAISARMVLGGAAGLGLAKMHEVSVRDGFVGAGPEDAFDVLMGAMLKLVNGELGVRLQPHLVGPVTAYIRFIQRLVRPPIRLPKPAAAPGQARGGWDT